MALELAPVADHTSEVLPCELEESGGSVVTPAVEPGTSDWSCHTNPEPGRRLAQTLNVRPGKGHAYQTPKTCFRVALQKWNYTAFHVGLAPLAAGTRSKALLPLRGNPDFWPVDASQRPPCGGVLSAWQVL